MKQAFLFISLLLSGICNAQLTGDLATQGRKILTNIVYEQEMSLQGVLVFDIAVNTAGKVTACDWNRAESTVHSTRSAYEAKNRILTQLTFESGNGFPTFQRGKVTITASVK